MSSITKLVALKAAAPSVMSVRSAGLGSLKPASLPTVNGRNLPSAYAGTDARAITADAASALRRGDDIGLASNVERGWQDSERTSAVMRDERPSASVMTVCEQQVDDTAQAVGTTGFAGMHGYPSWRTRT